MDADCGWCTRLLLWYRGTRRTLPWRENPSFYRTWVSEVMLQQTRVETVLGYFSSFLQRFPTIAALAEADVQDVLKAWEGLGYYSRARNLHRAACAIHFDRKGIPPATAAEMKELPGFGEYTSAAVASIAFGEPVPVLDGNVLRVMARFLAVDSPVRKRAAQTKIRQFLEPRIVDQPPGDFNQSLMELGARVCIPRNPACTECPLAPNCRACAEGRTAELPVSSPRPPVPHHAIAVAVIRDERDRVLIQRRPDDAMLGGLWEFPGGKQEAGETAREAAVRETREETGRHIAIVELLAVVEHAYSHFTITLSAFLARPVANMLDSHAASRHQERRWVPRCEVRNYPFPRANAKVLDALDERCRKGA